MYPDAANSWNEFDGVWFATASASSTDHSVRVHAGGALGEVLTAVLTALR